MTSFVRLTAAGRTVGLPADLIHRGIQRGEIPLKLFRIGGFRYVAKEDFEKWRDSLTVADAATQPTTEPTK